jgi:Domain of unknown function (DUF4350)
MPLTTGEKRGFIAFGIAMLLLMTLVAWLNSDNHEDEEGYPSSYSVQRHGGKAAFLLLQQSGYPVERWEKSPVQLPEDAVGVTLVLAGPESYPRPEEYTSITRFLLRGGQVLVAGTLPDHFVPQASAEFGDMRVGQAECKPVALTHLTRGGSISQDGDRIWNHTSDSAVVHFTDKADKPVVVSYAMSQGRVIWWASALPLANAGIRDRGNLDLLLNSVGGSKRILWDEYYHQEHSFGGGHRDNPAQMWALAQAAFLGLLLVLTFSRRSGPLVPLVQESRLSPLEFVETLGNVFQRARGTQVAVEIALNRFQQIAARRVDILGSASPEEIVLAMTQHGIKLPPDVAALVSSSGDVAADPELSQKQALEHVRALSLAMRLLDPPPTPAARSRDR